MIIQTSYGRMNYSFSVTMTNLISSMEAPGFRFHPTPEELISLFLVPKSRGDNAKYLLLIAEVNLCKHEPWDLPDKSIIKSDDEVWYFFCPRDLKYLNGKCSNRRTKAGYWKSTCQKKPIKAKRTKKVIGTRRTLVFYETARPKAKRTGWIIYEYDIITDSSLSYNMAQYVLCRLKKKSEDEKTKKGEQNHHMASVSDSETEPTQSMFSGFENQNGSHTTVNSACDESESSHHVACDHFENQNSNELMNSSARQVSELNHYIASDFINQNSNNLMSNSAYDGSGSSHSTAFNSETQYSNQPTVDSSHNGSESHCKAFDSETLLSNNMITVTIDEDRLLAYEEWLMAPGLKNQEWPFQHESERGPSAVMPSEFIKKSTSDSEPASLKAFDIKKAEFIQKSTGDSEPASLKAFDIRKTEFIQKPTGDSEPASLMAFDIKKTEFIQKSTGDSEPASLMAFDIKNQNLDKEIDISAFAYWSYTETPPDFGSPNPCKKTHMSGTLEEDSSSYTKASFSDNDQADVALPEVSPQLLAGLGGSFEQDYSPQHYT